MNKWITAILLIGLAIGSAEAADVCGRVSKGSKNAQMIPLTGKVRTSLAEDDQVICGASVITHEDAVWVELSDQTKLKIAPNSFFEFAGKNLRKYFLYRGDLMVSAPPSIGTVDFHTPNSITTFHGGVLMLEYAQKDKQTSVSCFNRKVEFKNRFHPEAMQVVSTGELSRLWIGETRIHPSEPELMEPASIKPAFSVFKMESQESDDLVAVVERAVSDRSKTFVADLESWEEVSVKNTKEAGRDIASVSIDDREAIVGIEMLKRQLYGDDEDWKVHDQSRRVPSSVVAGEILKDSAYERRKVQVKKKVKKVLDEINTFEPGEENE